ncbi:MAG: hypothetical protein AAF600_11125 [Bacteroidota bacterium]
MVRDNHYKALTNHIKKLLIGLSIEDEPSTIELEISEEFYRQALNKLEKQRRKLEKHQEEYLKAQEKFHSDYELIRKRWKKDVARIKRRVNNRETLNALGIPAFK